MKRVTTIRQVAFGTMLLLVAQTFGATSCLVLDKDLQALTKEVARMIITKAPPKHCVNFLLRSRFLMPPSKPGFADH